jgi:hypothetical protein
LTNIVDFHVFSNHKFRSEYFSTATSICSKYLPNAFCGNTLLRSPNHIPPSCLSEFRPGRDENEGIPPAPHDLRREGGCHKIDAPTPNPTASDKGGCRKIRREIRGTPPQSPRPQATGGAGPRPQTPQDLQWNGSGLFGCPCIHKWTNSAAHQWLSPLISPCDHTLTEGGGGRQRKIV